MVKRLFALAGSLGVSATPLLAQADPFGDVATELSTQGITVANFTTFILGLLGFFAVGLAVMVARRALKRNTSAS